MLVRLLGALRRSPERRAQDGRRRAAVRETRRAARSASGVGVFGSAVYGYQDGGRGGGVFGGGDGGGGGGDGGGGSC